MDNVSKRRRSEIMRGIRSSGNKSTERRLAAIMRQVGLAGWTTQRKDLPGKPDFAFARGKVAVFVDGCFWHGCPRCYREPKSNAAFWRAKIARNQARDRAVTGSLREAGWRVVRIWEHDLGTGGPVRRIVAALRKKNSA